MNKKVQNGDLATLPRLGLAFAPLVEAISGIGIAVEIKTAAKTHATLRLFTHRVIFVEPAHDSVCFLHGIELPNRAFLCLILNSLPLTI